MCVCEHVCLFTAIPLPSFYLSRTSLPFRNGGLHAPQAYFSCSHSTRWHINCQRESVLGTPLSSRQLIISNCFVIGGSARRSRPGRENGWGGKLGQSLLLTEGNVLLIASRFLCSFSLFHQPQWIRKQNWCILGVPCLPFNSRNIYNTTWGAYLNKTKVLNRTSLIIIIILI